MKVIFFDEAKPDDSYRHYHLGGVCIDEGHLTDVERQVAVIAEKASGTAELSRATELHAADIYHRKSNFKDWNKFEDRVAVIGEFIDILSREEVQLIDIKIDCSLLHEGQSAEEIGFMFLCERANDLVRSQQALGMLIGDRESDRLADRFARMLAGYRAEGTDFAFGRDIKNLVDSVHFTHSHLSRLLQLADVYTWLLQFMTRWRKSDNFRHLAVLNMIHVDGGFRLFPKKYKAWPKAVPQ